MPVYHNLTSALAQQEVSMSAAEMHGLISGILCGGNNDSSWRTLVYDLTNQGIAFPHALSQQLQQLYDSVNTTLRKAQFTFQLFLPTNEKDITVFDRADALAGWVNHFLLGLGVMQPRLDHVKDETGEAIGDMRTIARLGYDRDEDQKTLEKSLEEVIEYVRIAALLCHDTFTTRHPDAAKINSPVLH